MCVKYDEILANNTATHYIVSHRAVAVVAVSLNFHWAFKSKRVCLAQWICTVLMYDGFRFCLFLFFILCGGGFVFLSISDEDKIKTTTSDIYQIEPRARTSSFLDCVRSCVCWWHSSGDSVGISLVLLSSPPPLRFVRLAPSSLSSSFNLLRPPFLWTCRCECFAVSVQCNAMHWAVCCLYASM